MPNPVEYIKLILFFTGLALLCLSLAVHWRYAPACIAGWFLCWASVHAIYWFDHILDPDKFQIFDD
jgi:hypothetical protein